ncbi:DUF547 domain-containing protein [Pseudomonas chlororaphis]
MPLSPSKTPPPLPTFLPVGEVNTAQAHSGQLQSGGITYNMASNKTAQPIVVAPPLPSTLPVGDVPCFERPGELTHRGEKYTLSCGKAGDLTLPPCASEAKTRLQEIREDRAARIIVNAFRQSVADKVHTYMIGRGFDWEDTPKESAHSHIKTLSARNYSEIQAKLGALSPLEQTFVEKIMATPFIAVHCTDATPKTTNGTLCLYSRIRLDQLKVPFNEYNSPIEDRDQLGNDDFVFFSLEAGLTPQKPSSAFGRSMYYVDFEHPRLQQFAWLSLVDMRFPITPWLERHVPILEEDDYDVLSHCELKDTTQTIFSGPHMKAGIALSIVARARLVPESSREKLLGCPDSASINALMNGLYRPEVKVPRYFITQTFQKSQTLMESPFQYLKH